MLWYVIWCDDIVWYDMIYGVVWYAVVYDMVWSGMMCYDMLWYMMMWYGCCGMVYMYMVLHAVYFI